MAFASPILALCLLPLVGVAVWAAGRWLPAMSRWLCRAGVLTLLSAVAGPVFQCERPLKIVAMVDVSPSTRGALFRDPAAVTARLTPLLAGRPYTIQYFADGNQPTATEPWALRTRFEPPADADAIVLMSDGRFEGDPVDASRKLPAVFAVVDPALDSPGDARVRDVRRTEGGIVADVVSTGPGRPLYVAGVPQPGLPAGPSVTTTQVGGSDGGMTKISFAEQDRWPENDGVNYLDDGRRVRRISIGRSLPGFERVDRDTRGRLLLGSLIETTLIVSDAADVPPDAIPLYVEQSGGTLVVTGRPGAATSVPRARLPLSPVPPAGPARLVVLVDGSGSMSGVVLGDGFDKITRWHRALDAVNAAIAELPDTARVTILRFAGDMRVITSDSTPAAAVEQLRSAKGITPSGPTGLRAALESLATHAAATPTQVLLLTDGDAELGDVDRLASQLRDARMTVNAVTSADAAPLRRLCDATGGQVLGSVDVSAWATSAAGLVRGDGGRVVRTETLIGHDMLAGQTLTSSARWPAFLKDGATLLAGDPTVPAVAMWNVGLGRVVAIAAELSDEAIASVATRLERPTSDPRFNVRFDDKRGVVTLTAVDAAGPMNGFSPLLRRNEVETRFEQTGPGQYVAPLPRQSLPSHAVVSVAGHVVARPAILGRYPAEFDEIGNDRNTLARLAESTGGAMIEAGEVRPIEFKKKFVERPLRNWLAVAGTILLLAAIASLTGRSVRSPGMAGRG